MINKLMAGEHEAWGSGAFDLETLESRSLLSTVVGAQVTVTFDAAVIQTSMPRQQMVIANHVHQQAARQTSIFSGARDGFSSPIDAARQIAFRAAFAERLMIRHIAIAIGTNIDQFMPMPDNDGQTRGHVAFPHGPYAPGPKPGYSTPVDESVGQPDVPAAETKTSTTNVNVERNLRVLSAPQPQVELQPAADTVVTVPESQHAALSIASRAADVVGELATTVMHDADHGIAHRVGELQSPLLGALSSLGIHSLSPDAAESSSASASTSSAQLISMSQNQQPMVSRLASLVTQSTALDFARFGDPLAMLCDPLAAFADESAAAVASSIVSKTLPGSTSAWNVTAAVIAADVVLLTYLYRKGRRSRQVFRGLDIAFQLS